MNTKFNKVVSAALTTTTAVWASGVMLVIPVASAQTTADLQAQIAALLAQITQLQAQLNELRAQLPAESEVSGLLKQISDLSIESSLEVKLWKPGARKKDPSGIYTEIPVDVEVSGGYHALATFFDKVSKLSRIVNVTGLSMDGSKAVGETVFIQDKFVATTFAAEEQ